MNIKGLHSVYFVGIGGIGMSALARYYQSQGITVAGYDLTPSSLTKQLEDEGMAIHYEDNPALLPDHIDFVVYTPAGPQNLNELVELRRRSLPMMKRAEALKQVLLCALPYLPVLIAVACIKLPQGYLSNDETLIVASALHLEHYTWFYYLTTYFYISSLTKTGPR